jgi:hypothetical protein
MADVNPIMLYAPPLTTGDEKALLSTHLRLVQQALIWKLEDLGDADRRRPMTKTGTSLAGIVKHLTGVTSGYLCSAFGRGRETFPWEFDEELFYGLDMWATPDESTDEILAAYRRACHAAAQTIDELDLDAEGKHHTGLTVSLRWMILTVLMDTARHAGHADVVREGIDGSVGAGPVLSNTVPGDDEEYWRMYRARISGELDREGWMAYNRLRPGYDPSAWDDFKRRNHATRTPPDGPLR